MAGITSLLSNSYREKVLALMAELSETFGVPTHGWPHVSYHVAAIYDTGLAPALQQLAGQIAPFTLQTTGLGLFTGPEPVLYLALVRNQALTTVHERVWAVGEQHGLESVAYYEPAGWVPHITLSHFPADDTRLPDVIAALSRRNLSWEIPIDNLALLADAGSGIALHQQWSLTGV
ncbi:MAG: 2'-5' RNA ligase family protein [Anaerolineales bacterium]|nr:2'-5' RNA ligase family protein [Anaerolineales bacterium]